MRISDWSSDVCSSDLLGIEALAIVDRNSLAGIVRAHEAAKTTGVRLVVGCRLDLVDGMSVLVYPTDRPAYSRLCRLLSLGKKRGGKAKCHLEWADLGAYGEGLIAGLPPDIADEECGLRTRRLREAFGDRGLMELSERKRTRLNSSHKCAGDRKAAGRTQKKS